MNLIVANRFWAVNRGSAFVEPRPERSEGSFLERSHAWPLSWITWYHGVFL